MTAEIAIMNRIGVALAADSAVTLGMEANKIYTSADKVFHLSNDAPVGIMFYGSGDFAGLPWETIIKAYRDQRRERRYRTLQEYGVDFMRFLCSSRELWPQQRLDRTLRTTVDSILYSVRESIRRRLDKEAEQRNGLDKSELPSIIADEVKTWVVAAKTYDHIAGIGKSRRERVLPRYRALIAQSRDEVFETLPFTPAAKRNLSTLVKEMLTREWLGPLRTGIVIVGVGEDDYLPSLVAYEVDGIVLNLPRYKATVSDSVAESSGGMVLPFAQREMVDSFMQGIHRDLREYMEDSAKKLFEGAVNQIIEAVARADKKLGDNVRTAVGGSLQSLVSSLFDDWKQRRRKFWLPVIEIAGSLPKDELAAMAEALVNLTKFRRRITNVRETVGGPIDVAIITKGDGFVWIRRKHYFAADLNPRILARMQREVRL